mgnify:CR=1 FL=1
MSTEQKTARENESGNADVEIRLRQALQGLLAPLAAQQVTAREAYAAMTRVVARIEGDVPSGARLVGLLQLFNAQRPAGLPAIAAGTAGVAQDCVAAYRRSLVRASAQGVTHPSLPVDMIEGLNRWLERLHDLMQDEIRRPYEAEALNLRASLDEEREAMRITAEAERQTARAALQESENQLLQSQRQAQALLRQCETLEQRHVELNQGLHAAAAENRELSARVAVLQSKAEESEKRQGELEAALRAAQSASDEERRQRLLAMDSARVAEQELTREKEKRKAADLLARTLEKYLEEEKARAAALQLALSEAQLQSLKNAKDEESPASNRSGPNRIRPVRRAVAAPTPLRRKTLR